LRKEDFNIDIAEMIRECRSVTVDYTADGRPQISPYRGIRKGTIEEKEIRKVVRRRRRKKLPKRLIDLCLKIARRLMDEKIKFNMIFGREEVTISFDLDHFVRLYKDRILIAGFNNLNERPISLIYEFLKEYGEVKILRPLK